MSSYSGSYQPAFEGDAPHHHHRHGCGSFNWKPIEIVAMVMGFVFFWPVGLAIVGWKVWQRKHGYEGDLASFMRDKWQAKRAWAMAHRGEWGSASFATGFRSSGNSAFDDWRGAELARLEEERQKLVAAEREFADFMNSLRRAKDREEFDRFMNARRNWQPPQDGQPPQNGQPSA